MVMKAMKTSLLPAAPCSDNTGRHIFHEWVTSLKIVFMYFCVKLRTDFPTKMQLIVLELLFEVASRFNCANFPTVY
jgi:hypothetical protein